MKFLENTLDSNEKQAKFLHYLLSFGEDDPEASYQVAAEMSTVNQDNMACQQAHIIPIAAFSYKRNCSPKTPSAHTAKKLAAEIIKDGFVTMMEPILALPADTGDPTCIPIPAWEKECRPRTALQGFQLKYIKGGTRICTLFSLLALVHFDDVKLQDVSENLYQSCKRIAVYIMPAPTAHDVCLINAKMSMRGSLKKAWNVVTWLTTILQLRRNGDHDHVSLIRRWNEQCGQPDHKIRGSKQSCLSNLLEMPEDILEVVENMVSALDWESCPLTEDMLASKKLLPKSYTRNCSKLWQAIPLGSYILFYPIPDR